MKRIIKGTIYFLAAAMVMVILVAAVIGAIAMSARVTRPPAPPATAKVSLPWGAFDSDEMASDAEVGLQASIAESFRSESDAEFDRDGDGIRKYAVLTLSGGGSNGAYGAGILCGWTARGDRPDFKVVTGISTGSLQAILAFLGPEHDDTLRAIFTTYDTSRIYEKRGLLSAVLSDALYDTSPLKALIDHHVNENVVKAVAAKHRKGYRLFVGTTNMDTSELVIWDIGSIAASGRPGAREHIGRILLASCSIPVAFPPLYFEVDAEGQTYYEMHADGGLYASVFLRGFMLDVDDALDDAGISSSKIEASLYVIRNGLAVDEEVRRETGPNMLSLAAASVRELAEIGTISSIFRVFALAKLYGIAFNFTAIPLSYEGETDAILFDLELMQRLFEFGYRQAIDGKAWMKRPPGMDIDEQAFIRASLIHDADRAPGP